MSLPVIAIIGRPNVGKSTLFNRLIGKRYAITSPVPGTTRDRICHEADIGAYRAIIVDTGGLEFDKKKDIELDVQTQAKLAAAEANIIYFVIDTTQPLTASDLDCASYLRKSQKNIILIAHKSDKQRPKTPPEELYPLGFGDPIEVSSIHNLGLLELEKATEKSLKKLKWPKEKPRKTKSTAIAVVGKPNVGKSSLINSLIGKQRLIVSDKPGTTIDATDTPFSYGGSDFTLIDTAGLRRRGKMGKGIERYGVLRALQAISRSDVTCLMLDAGVGITNQDLHVSEYILDAGKGLMVLVNKTDLMDDKNTEQKKFLDLLQYRMSFMPWAPVLFISALEKKNIFRIFDLAKNIHAERCKKIPDADLRLFVKTAVAAHPPARSGRKITITDCKQTGVRPPAFTFAANKPDLIHFSYRRFLENELRRKFGFYGTPIMLNFS